MINLKCLHVDPDKFKNFANRSLINLKILQMISLINLKILQVSSC